MQKKNIFLHKSVGNAWACIVQTRLYTSWEGNSGTGTILQFF